MRGSMRRTWLTKVLETTRATAIAVTTLWGIRVEKEISLLDDVKILSFADLPLSRQKEMLEVPYYPDGRMSTSIFALQAPTAALVEAMEVSPYLTDSKTSLKSAYDYGRVDAIRLCL